MPDCHDRRAGALTPAARLRVELAHARAEGLEFSEVWPAAVADALDGAPRSHEWEEAFAWARPAFSDAYVGRGRARLREALHTILLTEVMEDNSTSDFTSRRVA